MREFNKKWQWMATLKALTKDDITKEDKILQTPIIEILNHLLLLHERSIAEEAQRNLQEQINKSLKR